MIFLNNYSKTGDFEYFAKIFYNFENIEHSILFCCSGLFLAKRKTFSVIKFYEEQQSKIRLNQFIDYDREYTFPEFLFKPGIKDGYPFEGKQYYLEYPKLIFIN